MLINQTIEKLHALKLTAMAAGLAEQCEQASYQASRFEERLSLLVDNELTERENRRLERYLKQAHLRADAVVEDVDFRRRRGLERHVVASLAQCDWVRNHHNVAVVGATGLGKTYLGCALANAAIRRGHSALVPAGAAHVGRARDRPGRRALPAPHGRLGTGRGAVDRRLPPPAAHRRAGGRHLGGDRGPRRASLDDPHQPAPGQDVARGDGRADHRRRDRGPPPREHAPHRAERSLDAPARHRRRRRPTGTPKDDEGCCELTEPPHLDVVQLRRRSRGAAVWMAVSVTGGSATSPRTGGRRRSAAVLRQSPSPASPALLLRRSGACRRHRRFVPRGWPSAPVGVTGGFWPVVGRRHRRHRRFSLRFWRSAPVDVVVVIPAVLLQFLAVCGGRRWSSPASPAVLLRFWRLRQSAVVLVTGVPAVLAFGSTGRRRSPSVVVTGVTGGSAGSGGRWSAVTGVHRPLAFRSPVDQRSPAALARSAAGRPVDVTRRHRRHRRFSLLLCRSASVASVVVTGVTRRLPRFGRRPSVGVTGGSSAVVLAGSPVFVLGFWPSAAVRWSSSPASPTVLPSVLGASVRAGRRRSSSPASPGGSAGRRPPVGGGRGRRSTGGPPASPAVLLRFWRSPAVGRGRVTGVTAVLLRFWRAAAVGVTGAIQRQVLRGWPSATRRVGRRHRRHRRFATAARASRQSSPSTRRCLPAGSCCGSGQSARPSRPWSPSTGEFSHRLWRSAPVGVGRPRARCHRRHRRHRWFCCGSRGLGRVGVTGAPCRGWPSAAVGVTGGSGAGGFWCWCGYSCGSGRSASVAVTGGSPGGSAGRRPAVAGGRRSSPASPAVLLRFWRSASVAVTDVTGGSAASAAVCAGRRRRRHRRFWPSAASRRRRRRVTGGHRRFCCGSGRLRQSSAVVVTGVTGGSPCGLAVCAGRVGRRHRRHRRFSCGSGRSAGGRRHRRFYCGSGPASPAFCAGFWPSAAVAVVVVTGVTGGSPFGSGGLRRSASVVVTDVTGGSAAVLAGLGRVGVTGALCRGWSSAVGVTGVSACGSGRSASVAVTASPTVLPSVAGGPRRSAPVVVTGVTRRGFWLRRPPVGGGRRHRRALPAVLPSAAVAAVVVTGVYRRPRRRHRRRPWRSPCTRRRAGGRRRPRDTGDVVSLLLWRSGAPPLGLGRRHRRHRWFCCGSAPVWGVSASPAPSAAVGRRRWSASPAVPVPVVTGAGAVLLRFCASAGSRASVAVSRRHRRHRRFSRRLRRSARGRRRRRHRRLWPVCGKSASTSPAVLLRFWRSAAVASVVVTGVTAVLLAGGLRRSASPASRRSAVGSAVGRRRRSSASTGVTGVLLLGFWPSAAVGVGRRHRRHRRFSAAVLAVAGSRRRSSSPASPAVLLGSGGRRRSAVVGLGVPGVSLGVTGGSAAVLRWGVSASPAPPAAVGRRRRSSSPAVPVPVVSGAGAVIPAVLPVGVCRRHRRFCCGVLAVCGSRRRSSSPASPGGSAGRRPPVGVVVVTGGSAGVRRSSHRRHRRFCCGSGRLRQSASVVVTDVTGVHPGVTGGSAAVLAVAGSRPWSSSPASPVVLPSALAVCAGRPRSSSPASPVVLLRFCAGACRRHRRPRRFCCGWPSAAVVVTGGSGAGGFWCWCGYSCGSAGRRRGGRRHRRHRRSRRFSPSARRSRRRSSSPASPVVLLRFWRSPAVGRRQSVAASVVVVVTRSQCRGRRHPVAAGRSSVSRRRRCRGRRLRRSPPVSWSRHRRRPAVSSPRSPPVSWSSSPGRRRWSWSSASPGRRQRGRRQSVRSVQSVAAVVGVVVTRASAAAVRRSAAR